MNNIFFNYQMEPFKMQYAQSHAMPQMSAKNKL